MLLDRVGELRERRRHALRAVVVGHRHLGPRREPDRGQGGVGVLVLELLVALTQTDSFRMRSVEIAR